MGSPADTVIGWTVVGLAAAGAAYYYSQSGKAKKSRARTPAIISEQSLPGESDTKSEPREKRKRKNTSKTKASELSEHTTNGIAEVTSDSQQKISIEAAKQHKEVGSKRKLHPGKLAHETGLETDKERDEQPEEDEGISNAEFAKQLSGLKTGTSLKKAAGTAEILKTRKQGKRNEESSPLIPNGAPPSGTPADGKASKVDGATSGQDLSTTSSTTGADADDDSSLQMSPELGASQLATSSGADISDMLEAPKRGPSVLRLTEPTNKQPPRQPKLPKVAPPPETKKQRQRRQKNEQNKLLREEAEQERRTALEKQKRTVREAEGRPAMNGVRSSQMPLTSKPSPWSQSSAAGIRVEASGEPSLLDTFDEPAARLSESSKPSEVKVDESQLPSEEEQMKQLSELDSDNAWSTVTKSSKGKQKAANAQVSNEKQKSLGGPNPAGNNKFAIVSNMMDTDWSSETDEAMVAAFPNQGFSSSTPNGTTA